MTSNAPQHEDFAWVRRILEKDAGALREFDRWLSKIPRLVAAHNRRLSRPLAREEQEDVAQRTVAVLWQKLPTYEGRASLASFAYRIASFEVFNAYRKVQRRTKHVHALGARDESELPASSAPDVDQQSRLLDLHRALDELGHDEARIVRMKSYDGHTFDEISDLLNLSVGQVKTRYYRSLERLQRALARGEDDGDG